jgi:uncharacterized protein
MNEVAITQVLLGEFYDKLGRLGEIVSRDAQLPNAPNKIKVVIGMRRAGKTYFLYQHILKLLDEGVPKSCILSVTA